MPLRYETIQRRQDYFKRFWGFTNRRYACVNQSGLSPSCRPTELVFDLLKQGPKRIVNIAAMTDQIYFDAGFCVV
jgi:hypothetical protein